MFILRHFYFKMYNPFFYFQFYATCSLIIMYSLTNINKTILLMKKELKKENI